MAETNETCIGNMIIKSLLLWVGGGQSGLRDFVMAVPVLRGRSHRGIYSDRKHASRSLIESGKILMWIESGCYWNLINQWDSAPWLRRHSQVTKAAHGMKVACLVFSAPKMSKSSSQVQHRHLRWSLLCAWRCRKVLFPGGTAVVDIEVFSNNTQVHYGV